MANDKEPKPIGQQVEPAGFGAVFVVIAVAIVVRLVSVPYRWLKRGINHVR